MIPPLQFLWQQLNGPQITAIVTAIYKYIKSSFDTKLDYFNAFSISTANDSQLTTIGALMDVGRPTVTELSASSLLFTDGKQPSTNHGFSNLVTDTTVGGKFAAEVAEVSAVTLAKEKPYRAMLLALAASTGELGSFVLLDDILYALRHTDNKNNTIGYTMTFQETTDAAKLRGDLSIAMEPEATWTTPYSNLALMQALANNTYAPVPRVFVTMNV